jgi:hypothetical protein
MTTRMTDEGDGSLPPSPGPTLIADVSFVLLAVDRSRLRGDGVKW